MVDPIREIVAADTLPTHMQLKAHEGFRPEAIHVTYVERYTPDRPAPLLARPADWTRQAKCLNQYDTYSSDHNPSGKAARMMCAGCPVADPCLEDALVEEGDVPPRLRAGVRGGLNPAARFKLSRLRGWEAADVCPQGCHRFDVEAIEWVDAGNTARCVAGEAREAS